MSPDAPLPDELAACQRELRHTRCVLSETAAACDQLQQDLARLKEELELLKRFRFGRRSERFVEPPGQGHLFEDAAETSETAEAADDPPLEDAAHSQRRRRKGHGWSKLPAHLPRVEVLVDLPPDQRLCPDCGEPLERIGEDRSERVDVIPAKVIVKLLVRPKYVCPHRHGVRQAELPPSPVAGGRFDFGCVAHVVTSKIADHLPLYRQQNQLARSGLALSRATLCAMLIQAAVLLEPLADLMKRRLLAVDALGADETPVRLLDRTLAAGVRLARFWLFRGFVAAPYNVFHFHESRSRDGPAEFLREFRGIVKVDAYGVDDGVYLSSDGRIVASCCWAHVRRKFDEARSSHPRLAAEALAIIQQMYDVEDRARDLTPEERRAMRQCESAPLVERFRAWLEAQAPQALPKLKFGEAVGYARNQWASLTNYLDDGRLPIDNNDVERDLRALTIGRKNWLFIGSPAAGPHAAVLYTIVASAARHHLDVWAYLRDVLERLSTGGVTLEGLLPDVWAASHPDSIHKFRRHEQTARAAATASRRARRRAKHG